MMTDAKAEKPIILFFNDHFGESLATAHFATASGCEFTEDRRLFRKAAAVVFHIPTLRRMGWIRKRRGQLWVAWSMESEANYPRLADPAFMRKFDIAMTYRRSSDIWCPYIPPAAAFDRAQAEPVPPKTATAPALMFQSARFNLSGRNEFTRELMDHIDIHSYGRFLNNRALPADDRGQETKLAIAATYKFCLGFENSFGEDYVTEKFFGPLLCGTVPVYRGADNIGAFAPAPDSYIDARKFSGARELAEYLKYLDGDDVAYRRYFAWRDAGPTAEFRRLLAEAAEEPFSRLAEMVVRGAAVARTRLADASASSGRTAG
jgi:alpha-1,3-fucosyltransferase 10